VSFGNCFVVHEYRFPLVLMADRLSLPFLGLTVGLSGLIGQFSATYLHRERGFLPSFCYCTFSPLDLCCHLPPVHLTCSPPAGRWSASRRYC
jgi:hypothetical protein